jgi:exopolysaccharide biosynthesis protein
MLKQISLGLLGGLLLTGLAAPQVVATEAVKYRFFKDKDQHMPLNVHLVEVDLKNPQVNLGVALAKGKASGGERVSRIAERYGAVAAINGSFFHGRKIPTSVGLVMKDGEIIADSGHRRTSLGITRNNDVIIGIPKVTTGVYHAKKDRFQIISGINQPRKSKQTIVYTPHFGKYTQTNQYGREVVVENNRVTRYSYGNTQIPANGFVLSAHGKNPQEIKQMYPVGSALHLRARRYEPWNEVETIITGAPHLVRSGQIYNTYFQEKLQASLKRPNARSAVGVTHNRKLLLVNVFPAKKGGVTYTRLAQIMKRLGATEAMGLDGGGSTSLYISQKGINSNRAITNALIVTVDKNKGK